MIEVSKSQSAALVRVLGRLDSNNAAASEREILAALGQDVDAVAMDLGELEYISSAGLRVLLILAKKMRQIGGRFALARLRPQIREVMEVSGFTAIIPCFSTLEEALQAIGATARP